MAALINLDEMSISSDNDTDNFRSASLAIEQLFSSIEIIMELRRILINYNFGQANNTTNDADIAS